MRDKDDMSDELPRGVIGIPGEWSSHAELMDAIASRGRGYVCAGGLLIEAASMRVFTLEEYEFEPRMRAAFEAAGAGWIPKKDLDRIGKHKRTAYVTGEVGSVEAARHLMQAADAVLASGGLGVKVETAGVAHPASAWPLLCEDQEPGALLHAMVAFAGEGACYYSCGMQHFGLRDANACDDSLSPASAGRLLEGFCGYELAEDRDMLDNDTFSLEDGEPRYTIKKEPCMEFEPDDLFFNPYGVWRLVRADDGMP